MFHHRIENRQQLAHTRRQGHFFLFNWLRLLGSTKTPQIDPLNSSGFVAA
jgi:hypothetical protein